MAASANGMWTFELRQQGLQPAHHAGNVRRLFLGVPGAPDEVRGDLGAAGGSGTTVMAKMARMETAPAGKPAVETLVDQPSVPSVSAPSSVSVPVSRRPLPLTSR